LNVAPEAQRLAHPEGPLDHGGQRNDWKGQDQRNPEPAAEVRDHLRMLPGVSVVTGAAGGGGSVLGLPLDVVGLIVPPRLRPRPRLRRDLHLHLYGRTLHADRIARDAARRRSAQHRTGLDVVDSPMPGARDLPTRHTALAQRTATVRARVV